MKTFLIGFLVSLVFINFGSTFIANASCPAGYTSQTVSYRDVNSCMWKITFCYKCGISAGQPSYITFDEIIPDTIPSLCGGYNPPYYKTPGIPPSKDDLVDFIISSFKSLCTVPSCGDPVDCNNALTLVISYPVCWQWHIYGSVSGGVWSFYKWLQPCPAVGGTGVCNISCKVCIDPGTTDIIKCPNSTCTFEEYGVTCATAPVIQYGDIPEPSHNPINLGNHTYGACFKYVTDCQ